MRREIIAALGVVALAASGCSQGGDESPPPPANGTVHDEGARPGDNAAGGTEGATHGTDGVARPERASTPASHVPPTQAFWRNGDPRAGKVVYQTYCQTCHGSEGMGDGPTAQTLDPKPRNFTVGKFKFDTNGDGDVGEPQDLANVISHGAGAYGGSPQMLAWGPVLSKEQIRNVIAYVRTLKRSGS